MAQPLDFLDTQPSGNGSNVIGLRALEDLFFSQGKGLVLRDTVNGKYYRVTMVDGFLTQEEITP